MEPLPPVAQVQKPVSQRRFFSEIFFLRVAVAVGRLLSVVVADACGCLLLAGALRRFPVVVAASVFPPTEGLILTMPSKKVFSCKVVKGVHRWEEKSGKLKSESIRYGGLLAPPPSMLSCDLTPHAIATKRRMDTKKKSTLPAHPQH